jgi:hypothetical protein
MAEWAISRIHALWQLPVETKEIHDKMQLEPDDDDWLTIDDIEFDQMLNNEEQAFSEVVRNKYNCINLSIITVICGLDDWRRIGGNSSI